jgi:hypothetical protein
VRKQVCQIKAIVIIVSGSSLQNISHPFTWIYIQGLAGFNQRIHDGSIFSRIMIATEQIIFSTYPITARFHAMQTRGSGGNLDLFQALFLTIPFLQVYLTQNLFVAGKNALLLVSFILKML